jgi:hypothetical protein
VVGVVNIITRKVHSHHFDCQCFISLVRSIVRKNSEAGEEIYQAYKYVKRKYQETLENYKRKKKTLKYY